MMEAFFIMIGILLGAVVAWALLRGRSGQITELSCKVKELEARAETLLQEKLELDKDLAVRLLDRMSDFLVFPAPASG